ncbi:DUF4595 domain-containing protein [Flavobacterium chungbukense]
MKKKFCYLLFIITGVISSCSNEVETKKPQEPVQEVLPKTISFQPKSSNEKEKLQTSTFVYNGNKIVSVSCVAYNKIMKTVFTYEGNFITKTEGFMDNQLITTIKYTYNNDKLKESILTLPSANSDSDFYVKDVFTHNPDGTVSYVRFREHKPDTAEDEKILSFSNSNLDKITTKYNGEAPYYKYSYQYKYDNKNNPLKNITGLNLIMLEGTLYNGHDMPNGDFGINDFGLNNITEKITSISSKNDTSTYVEKFNYTYDKNGYPLTKSSDESEYNIIYTY